MIQINEKFIIFLYVIFLCVTKTTFLCIIFSQHLHGFPNAGKLYFFVFYIL